MGNDELRQFQRNAIEQLLAARTPKGHWEGELSTSALSTATSIVALACVNEDKHHGLIYRGSDWLIANQNSDGGWGDTTKSDSNISTTLLCWSALQKCRAESDSFSSVTRAGYWIRDYVGSLDPHQIAETVKARYGKDRTFSVPILMLCAICGTLGKRGWKLVLPLPYELAAFPRSWFAAMNLPVVSYALPALIAIGRVRYEKVKPLLIDPFFWIRLFAWPKVSRLLHRIQPASGGYLEAAPLTGFVTMALASAGKKDHPAARLGVEFLTGNVRPDGSWPIDTNLATWATTLAVKALNSRLKRVQSSIEEGTIADCRGYNEASILRWLLDQQYSEIHPFTNSAPGGWAWTDLSGGVPDADDTPGTMLAIHSLSDGENFEECRSAAENGAVWLLDLQNNDGGIPTFCKGWGALPFDRSSPDLTAHTLRAWQLWKPHFSDELRERIEKGTTRAIRFLKNTQGRDGEWIPLWFGNQHRNRDEENPTYGTAMVCRALEICEGEESRKLFRRGRDWLVENQNTDGGWGGGKGTPSSIEETALAVSALAGSDSEAVNRGIGWLKNATANGTEFSSSPIGFYFAKLWYFERIYPMVWTVEALGRSLDLE